MDGAALERPMAAASVVAVSFIIAGVCIVDTVCWLGSFQRVMLALLGGREVKIAKSYVYPDVTRST